MCGRGSLTKTEKELEERFEAQFYSEDLERYNPLPNFNIAPTHLLPIITNEDPHHFKLFQWGLIPSWAKDHKIGSKMINARVEGLLEKPFFKTALQKRRCLVIMDGFYEWKLEGKTKKPYRIQVEQGNLFAMAGLYDFWKNPQGNLISSFTIITQPANEFMKELHDRMPAILSPEEERLWLDPQLSIEQLLKLIHPYPDSHMLAYEVSDKINNVRNNSEELIKHV